MPRRKPAVPVVNPEVIPAILYGSGSTVEVPVAALICNNGGRILDAFNAVRYGGDRRHIPIVIPGYAGGTYFVVDMIPRI